MTVYYSRYDCDFTNTWLCIIQKYTTVFSQHYAHIFTTIRQCIHNGMTTLWLCIHNDTTVNISTTIWPYVHNDMTVYWQWYDSVFTLRWCIHNDMIVYLKHHDHVYSQRYDCVLTTGYDDAYLRSDRVFITIRPCVFTIRPCVLTIWPFIHNDATVYSQRYERVFTSIRLCIHDYSYTRILTEQKTKWLSLKADCLPNPNGTTVLC